VEEAEVDFSAFEAMPQDVVDRLNILDEEAIPARREDGRSLTIEAARLAPEKGDGLVRRAQRVEMILRGIVPAMGELGTTERDLLTGLQLLRLVARWIANVSEDGSSKVRRSVRVPVVSEEGWCWEIADRVYFGEGWASKHESLLLQAYGDMPRRLLIPFPDLKFSGGEEFLAEWRGIMETVGVHGRPKVIQIKAGKGPPQFIAQRGTYTLSVNESPPCPMPEIEDGWSEYLRHCAGRSTAVSSNRTYRFISLSWIDGLEREVSQKAILEMILKEPRSYLEFTESKIGRADDGGGSDKSDHDSPWVWAIKNADWKCIPTGGGLRRPSESWLIRRHIESERNGRLRFLASVSREFLSADTLLRHLGVPDWDNPDFGALYRELERCAGHIRDSSTSHYLLGQLVEELYDRIDRALSHGADGVEEMLGIGSLPLLRSGNLEAVVPSELEVAYVDDDSDRLAFFRLNNDILVWPFTIREGSAKGHPLVHQIRRSFGERAAILVSEVEVPTGFKAFGQPDSLRSILRTLNVPDPADTLLDLACLLCMGKAGLSPADPEFGLSWGQFNLLKVVRGEFPASVSAKHFFSFRDGGPLLEIGDTCNADDLLENLWRLGIERDLLSAYVRSFQKNQIPSFFDERRFSSSRREDVRLAVSEFSIDQREEIRSAIFAVRRKLLGEDVVEFGKQWMEKCESGDEFSKWLGVPFSEGRLEESLAASTPEDRSLAILRLGGVEIAAWQEARRALGLAPHQFTESGQLWRRLLRQVGAILKGWVARRLNSDLDSARLQIEILCDLQPPESVLEATPDVPGTLFTVIEMAERLFGDEDNRSNWGRPLELLRRVEPVGAVSSSSVQIGDEAPQRDVNEYLDTPEVERERRAKEWCCEYLRIAASLEGIEQGLELLMASGRLRALTEGFWANRFSMIPVLQAALADAAPGALATMKDKGAFKRMSDFNQLRDCFPEIKPEGPQLGVVIATPQLRMRIFGREVSEDRIPALLRGDGELAMLLEKSLEDECFNPSTEFVRENALAPVLSTKIGSPGRRSHQDLNQTQNVKNLVGKIGEFYIYKWLMRECPESVDQECWVSSNRTAFLNCEDGDDSVGYDFKVNPGDERLTGRNDGQRLLIEVKSKSGADDGHFFMTATEWRRAAEASANPTEEYWVLVIQNVLESPQIAQVIKDPHRLMAEGKLVFQHESLSVRVGKAKETNIS
jgi:hypothetical protein